MLPGVHCLADIEAQPVQWLWYPYIPLEHLTLVYGNGDVRKSWLSLAIGAAVTRGGKVCDLDAQELEQGGVLLCTSEDDPAATVRPRAEGLGADLSREAGLAERTLRRAREQICQRPRRFGDRAR